jgi:hypothetical protein
MQPRSPNSQRIPLHSRRLRRDRRGVAIVVVLGLISIALALSYTMMRAQGTTLKIQQNSRRQADARQAAQSGLMAGLGQLHHSDWKGVGTTLTGRLNESESYTVEYTAGDWRLSPTHAEFADWPYRLTLKVTGYAMAEDGGATSTHRLLAVTRLVPTALSATPPDWSHMQQFTVYQWTNANFTVDIPSRIEGAVWTQGPVRVSGTYPNTRAARLRYLGDLNAMRLAGRPDYRPLSGPLHWRNIQSTWTVDLVTNTLGVATQTASQKTAADWRHPGTVETYRLYPGGPEYQVPRVEEILENMTLAPHPQDNPLGIFVREGSLELRNNVSVVGELVTTGDLFISGRSVRLQSPDLKPAGASNLPVRLPAAVVGRHFRVFAGAAATIQGAVLAWDDAEVRAGTELTQFELRGRLVSKQFTVGPRTEWNYGRATWVDLYNIFVWQLTASGQTRIDYFPEFMSYVGRRPAPRIVLAPDATAHVDHFPVPQAEVYAPAAADKGLRWELIDWKDEG